MLTKEKCLDALSTLEMEIMHASSLSYKYKERVLSVSNVLFQLINEHFDNSADFYHFKLHADSTLKTFKKDELIDYIHMLYYNWQATDWAYNNVVKANFQLLDEINELKRNRKQSIDEKIY